MRFFNTAGPMRLEDNYCIPPLDLLDRDEIFALIEDQQYFALYAPRQTGKTSSLLALRDELNLTGCYRAVYTSVETTQIADEDVDAAMRCVLGKLGSAARIDLNDSFVANVWPEILEKHGGYTALRHVLRQWSNSDSRPLVWMVDEVDALIGDSLISVLRQLRTGYPNRPERFPQSVILCGVRDVKDYGDRVRPEKPVIAGGGIFNIKAASIRLRDFDESQVRALLSQHTEDSGQQWSESALQEVWRSACGQPWLVNALAAEAVEAIRNRGQCIEIDDIHAAREVLIRRNDIHLYQLAHKLQDDRVRRVIEPLLSGELDCWTLERDDLQYVRDLGLIKDRPQLEIANPIYLEMIRHNMITSVNTFLLIEPAIFVEDGNLVVDRLLATFQEFFQNRSENWLRRFHYRAVAPHFLLQAFLQKAVNGDGQIEWECGHGLRRIDLLVVWGEFEQKAVIECKLRSKDLERTIEEGLSQTADYMDICGTNDGHLVIFDRSESRTWDERIFKLQRTIGDKSVTVWGM